MAAEGEIGKWRVILNDNNEGKFLYQKSLHYRTKLSSHLRL
jgi:hypothetical protein